jgi:hypothetical protein
MDRLDAVELVRTKADHLDLESSQSLPAGSVHSPSPAIIWGTRSITLRDRCVVYRDIVARQSVVTILPFWSIDSFAIKVSRSIWMLFLMASCFLASVWIWFQSPVILDGIVVSFWGHRIPVYQLIALLFFLSGAITLTIYTAYPKPELVIYNHSGKNKIRFVLSGRMENALEQFVAQVEAQMSRV